MADFLSRLAGRTLGRVDLVRPTAPRSFGPGPKLDIDYSDVQQPATPGEAISDDRESPFAQQAPTPQPRRPNRGPLVEKPGQPESTPPVLSFIEVGDQPQPGQRTTPTSDDREPETVRPAPPEAARTEPDRTASTDRSSRSAATETFGEALPTTERHSEPPLVTPVKRKSDGSVPVRPNSEARSVDKPIDLASRGGDWDTRARFDEFPAAGALERHSGIVRPSEPTPTSHRTAASHPNDQSQLDAGRTVDPVSGNYHQRLAATNRDVRPPLVPLETQGGEARLDIAGEGKSRAVRMRTRGGVRADAELPSIRVTIGRVEVRASTPPASPTPTPRPRYQPNLTLDQYLKQRNEGGS